MAISLLSLLVGHDGPAPMGLNLRSLGFEISIYANFYVSTAFVICIYIYIYMHFLLQELYCELKMLKT